MANRVKALKNVSVVYGTFDMTANLDTASLENTVEAVDTTTFASDGQEQSPGAPGFSVSVGGAWSKALDDVLGLDGAEPPETLRDLVVAFGPTGGKAIRTWDGTETTGAFISNYQIQADNPLQNLKWTGTLTCSGAPVRTTG